jgi:hypothetical protein
MLRGLHNAANGVSQRDQPAESTGIEHPGNALSLILLVLLLLMLLA